jgi:hypothetical protein
MKISIHFHTYIRQYGPQVQKCYVCGALHDVDEKNNVKLKVPGVPLAKLSQEYPFPEYEPYRTGAYRVRFSTGNWCTHLRMWDADIRQFRDGACLFAAHSIMGWQGLAGDMEHLKTMPYKLGAPLSIVGDDDELYEETR